MTGDFGPPSLYQEVVLRSLIDSLSLRLDSSLRPFVMTCLSLVALGQRTDLLQETSVAAPSSEGRETLNEKNLEEQATHGKDGDSRLAETAAMPTKPQPNLSRTGRKFASLDAPREKTFDGPQSPLKFKSNSWPGLPAETDSSVCGFSSHDRKKTTGETPLAPPPRERFFDKDGAPNLEDSGNKLKSLAERISSEALEEVMGSPIPPGETFLPSFLGNFDSKEEEEEGRCLGDVPRLRIAKVNFISC